MSSSRWWTTAAKGYDMKKVPNDMAERLLQHSREILGEDDLSINRVAKVTGIPRPTLYYYFSGQEHLLSFFVDYAYERFFEAVSAAAEEPGTPTERLVRSLVAGMTLGHEEPWRAAAIVRGIAASGSTLSEMGSLYERFEPIRRLLLEGRDAGELQFDDIELALTVLFGSTLTYVMLQVQRIGEVPSEGVAAVANLVLAGLTGHGRPTSPAAPARNGAVGRAKAARKVRTR
jgi:AcrR family transcriptional regulator